MSADVMSHQMGPTPAAENQPNSETHPRSVIVVAGRYEVDLDRPLGEGGLALVYLGRDLRTRRQVAMRTLRMQYRTDVATRARFRQETRIQALANHPNIARVYDLHEEQAAPWAVHEYVPGRTLQELLAENVSYPPGDAADLLDQVASALAHLHGRGFVHLDVKPENLLVTPDGTVKVIDFGLAQESGGPQASIGGVTFGTVAYLAPEQARGDTVESGTDIYQLGCVIYEVLTGQPPFGLSRPVRSEADRAQHQRIIDAHLDEEPRPPSQVRPDLAIPHALDDVVLWSLAKRPTERYSDVTAFARLFRGAIEPGSPPLASHTTVPVRVATGGATTSADHPPAPSSTRDRPQREPIGATPIYDPFALGSEASAPGVARRVFEGGARSVRRARGLRRWLWRLTLVVLLANAILAGVILATRGTGSLLPGGSNLRPGGQAEVTVNALNVRAAPGATASELTGLPEGTRVSITGDATTTDGLTWWPVRFSVNGEAREGFVWGGGLTPINEGFLPSVRDGFVERLDDARDWITDRVPG